MLSDSPRYDLAIKDPFIFTGIILQKREKRTIGFQTALTGSDEPFLFPSSVVRRAQ